MDAKVDRGDSPILRPPIYWLTGRLEVSFCYLQDPHRQILAFNEAR